MLYIKCSLCGLDIKVKYEVYVNFYSLNFHKPCFEIYKNHSNDVRNSINNKVEEPKILGIIKS